MHYGLDLAVVSLEPNPRNFEQLITEHAFSSPENSELFAWYGIETAIGETNSMAPMATNPEFAVDEIGTLLINEETELRNNRDIVEVMSLQTAIDHARFHFSLHRGGWSSRRHRNYRRKGEIPSRRLIKYLFPLRPQYKWMFPRNRSFTGSNKGFLPNWRRTKRTCFPYPQCTC